MLDGLGQLLAGESPLDELGKLRLDMVKAGKEVVDLAMLNPDLPPQRFLVDKLVEASLKPTSHRYAVSRGIRRLREAFAQKYQTRFGVSLDPEAQICTCMGTKDALEQILTAFTQPGGSVILGAPTYPAYLSACLRRNLVPSFFHISHDITAMRDELLELIGKTRPAVVLLNFPNNPTGIAVDRDFLRAIASAAEERGALLVNDFVYGEMLFSGQSACSVLAAAGGSDRVLETYSLSKAYSVPGWRVGMVAGNRQKVRLISRLKSYADYGLFLPVQFAAAAALSYKGSDLVVPYVREYEARCRLLVKGLKALGWDVSLPAGGASVWARYNFDESSFSFVKRLLLEYGVQVLPGGAFGEAYDRHIRLAAVVSEEVIRDVLSYFSDIR